MKQEKQALFFSSLCTKHKSIRKITNNTNNNNNNINNKIFGIRDNPYHYKKDKSVRRMPTSNEQYLSAHFKQIIARFNSIIDKHTQEECDVEEAIFNDLSYKYQNIINHKKFESLLNNKAFTTNKEVLKTLKAWVDEAKEISTFKQLKDFMDI